MEAQSPHFGCFPLQHPSTPETIFCSDIGSDGQPNRRRKVHTKSRSGCKNCKARKVKCDEEQPCRNCVKRGQICGFNSSSKPSSTVRARQPIQKLRSLPQIAEQLSPINLAHMRLLHHFEAFTSRTFIMDPEIWKESVVALALQNTFLMHAVFLVAAVHLQHLQPDDRGHHKAALEHLSQVLPSFRNAIATISHSKEESSGNALVACSMLLLQYSWVVDSEGWNNLLGLYRGLTSVVLKLFDTVERSCFSSMLKYSPRMRIECHLGGCTVPSDEAIFAHCLTCTKISNTQNMHLDDFTDLSRRLMTILHALKLRRRDLETSDLILDIARYLFSLPNLLPDGFIGLLMIEDGRAQVMLLYYFAAVSRLPSERFWWMRERAVYMFEAISTSLGDTCMECTGRAREILDEGDSD